MGTVTLLAVESSPFVQTVVVPLMVALLGSGGFAAVGSALREKRERREAPLKPALEQDALRVGTESIASVTMERALNAANTRITELEGRLKDAETRAEKVARQLRRQEDIADDLRDRLRGLGADPA